MILQWHLKSIVSEDRPTTKATPSLQICGSNFKPLFHEGIQSCDLLWT